MNNSINIHDRIQEMMKIKFKGKDKFPHPENIPQIKLKKAKAKPRKSPKISDQNRRISGLQEEDAVCSSRLSQQFNSQLLNKASLIIEEREFNMKNIRLSETSPGHLQSEKKLIDSLLMKFQQTQQNALLAQSKRKLHSKLQLVEQKPKFNEKVIDLVKLPIIANAKNLNVMQRKRGLNKWGENKFQYNRQGSEDHNEQMASFLKQVEKQKLQHQNFKIKVHKDINRIENERDMSFHQKQLGELLELKNAYFFHDVFMRYRKVRNHLSIQEI